MAQLLGGALGRMGQAVAKVVSDRDDVRLAARFAAKSGVPLIAMGDFNDAAWSDTSQRFKHVGGYIDPRIGRA